MWDPAAAGRAGAGEPAGKCSLVLHVCGTARGGSHRGARAPLQLRLHGCWPRHCVRALAVGGGRSLYCFQGFGVLAKGQLTYLVAFRLGCCGWSQALPCHSIPPAWALGVVGV